MLGLSTLPGIGSAVLRRLGDPTTALEAFLHEDIRSFTDLVNSYGAKFNPMTVSESSWDELKKLLYLRGRAQVKELCKQQIYCITPSSEIYPSKLLDLGSKKPNWLFLKGNLALLEESSIAVVGTRDASDAGVFLTQYVVSLCADYQVPVVSGLARGIDTVAHEWSLFTKTPTISILGSGILRPYPARNSSLFQRIIDADGLVISEYLPHQDPSADMFVWRNRLQACLSDCVIAPEWKHKSGTAHTIRFAAELQRLSISLNLNGVELKGDEGAGSLHLELPTDHQELLNIIREIAEYDYKKHILDVENTILKPVQTSLF